MKQKRFITTLLTFAFMAITLTACSSSEATGETTATQETQEIVVESVEEEVVEETTQTVVEEVKEETPQTETSESQKILTKEDIDVNSDLPGEEWIASIGTDIEEPFIAIWNDTDGTKKILEEGERHQVNDNDVIFLYIPIFAEPVWVDPGDIWTDIKNVENGKIRKIDKNSIQEETVVIFHVREVFDEWYKELSFVLEVSE